MTKYKVFEWNKDQCIINYKGYWDLCQFDYLGRKARALKSTHYISLGCVFAVYSVYYHFNILISVITTF